LADADGEMIVSVEAYEEICAFMDYFSFEESGKFLADFRQKNFGDQDQVRLLYSKAYPPVELTDEYLERIKDAIRAVPEGAKFVQNIEKAVAMFKLAK